MDPAVPLGTTAVVWVASAGPGPTEIVFEGCVALSPAAVKKRVRSPTTPVSVSVANVAVPLPSVVTVVWPLNAGLPESSTANTFVPA